MKVTQIVNVSVSLSATPASTTNFSVPLLLVDHADIPIDRRYRVTSRSSYTSEYTSGTTHYNWLAALWNSGSLNPLQSYVGRWVSAASSPYIVFASPAAYSAFTSTADGTMTINDGTNTDDLTAMDFSACNSMSDVAAVIQTTMQAIGAPNITGLDTATCFVDKLGRVIIQNSTTGASAATISAESQGTGTDITADAFLGSDFSQAGLDAETLGAALNAILALDNTPFAICELGASVSQKVAFSTSVNSLPKIYLCRSNNSDCKDSADSTNEFYQINALSHNLTHMTYTEHTTQYPDAVVCGSLLPKDEGSYSFALNSLSGLSESGLDADGTTVKPLTDTERTAIEDINGDYLITPSSITHLRHGLAASGNEMRVMIAKLYMSAKVSEDIYAYMIANDVVTYSDDDIQALKGIIKYYADILSDRGLLDRTSYTWNMPAAADFTSTQKATHTMTLSNVFSADVLQSVNDAVISLSFNV